MAQNETSVSGDVVWQDGDALSETNLTRAAAKSNATDYVERGMGVTVDSGSNTVDIGSGHAIIQDGIHAYDVFPNQANGVSLPGSGTNYIYVALKPEADDDVYFHIDEDKSPPSDPSLLIATADAGTGSSTTENRAPDGEFEMVDTEQLNIGVSEFAVFEDFGDNKLSSDRENSFAAEIVDPEQGPILGKYRPSWNERSSPNPGVRNNRLEQDLKNHGGADLSLSDYILTAGVWQFDFQYTTLGNGDDHIGWVIKNTNDDNIEFFASDSGKIGLQKETGGGGTNMIVGRWGTAGTGDTEPHTLRWIRYIKTNGTVHNELFIDGRSVGVSTDSYYPGSLEQQLITISDSGGGSVIHADNFIAMPQQHAKSPSRVPPSFDYILLEDFGDNALSNRNGSFVANTVSTNEGVAAGVYRPEWEEKQAFNPGPQNGRLEHDIGSNGSGVIELDGRIMTAGVWEFDFQFTTLGNDDDNVTWRVVRENSGNFIAILATDAGDVKIQKAEGGSKSTIISGSWGGGTGDNNPHTIKAERYVEMDGSVEWELFVDGSSQGTSLDSFFPSKLSQRLEANDSGGGSVVQMDNFRAIPQ